MHEVVVIVRPDAVDLVVRGHDRARVRLTHADLESAEVDLAQGALGDARVVARAVGLLVVRREVLRARRDARALHPRHDRRADEPRDERVFGEVLEVAAAERVAVDVHAGAEQHVRTLADHLLAVQGREFAHEGGVPRRRERGARRQQRRVGAEPDAAGPSVVVTGRTPLARSDSETPPSTPALPAAPSGLCIVTSPRASRESSSSESCAMNASRPAAPLATSSRRMPRSPVGAISVGSAASTRSRCETDAVGTSSHCGIGGRRRRGRASCGETVCPARGRWPR